MSRWVIRVGGSYVYVGRICRWVIYVGGSHVQLGQKNMFLQSDIFI